MKTPLLLAVARYTPLADIANAVMAPEHESSVNVAAFFQSERDTVTSSATSLRMNSEHEMSALTKSTRSDEEVLARGMPYSRAIMHPLWRTGRKVGSGYAERLNHNALGIHNSRDNSVNDRDLLSTLFRHIPYDDLAVCSTGCLAKN